MRILGLHFDRPYIRWVTLESKGKKILGAKSFIQADDEDVKRLYMAQKLDRVATSMSTLVRHVDLRLASMRKIEQGLKFQVESLTHLSPEDIVYSAEITPRKGALIFLSSKDSLQSHLKEWEIAPDLVTSQSQALLKFVEFRCASWKSGFVVHLGSEEWTCIWIEDGKLNKSFVIEEGVEALLASLWEDRKKVLLLNEVKGVAKQIDLFHLKEHLNPHLSEKLKTVREHLTSVLKTFQQSGGEKQVLFTGRIDAFGQFPKYLLEKSENSIFEPSLPLSLEESKCAIAIGSALECMERKKIQFLTGDFTPQKQWKKAGSWALSLIACSIGLSAFFVGVGWDLFRSEKESVKNSFTRMVERMNPSVASTIFDEGMEVGANQAVRAIQKFDREAPFLLQAPTISEVLSWITAQSLDLTDLKYQLLSFPHIGSARDPYSAKVEIEFCADVLTGRKFHEMLLEGDHLVDSNQEISWETLEGNKFRTSFFLKNRTPYVP